MKKILIIGCAATGKTTLAKELSRHLNVPHVQLDYLYWKPGWIDGGLDEFMERMYQKIDEPAWIMDGTYVRALMPRAMRAELIIFLDMPRWICISRIFKRYAMWLMGLFNAPHGYAPCMRGSFFYYLWTHKQLMRPRILAVLTLIEKVQPAVQVVTLRSPREVDRWVQTFLKQLNA